MQNHLEDVVINSFISKYRNNPLLNLAQNQTLTKEQILTSNFNRPLLKHYLIKLLDSEKLTQEENNSVNDLMDEIISYEYVAHGFKREYNGYDTGVL